MPIRLAKELRELSPPCLYGLAAAAAAGLLLPQRLATVVAAAVFALCCLYLGSRSFGSELDLGTLPRLLAQPIARSRIWVEKMTTAAAVSVAGYATLSAALAVAGRDPIPWRLQALAVFVALAAAPTATLLLGDGLRGLSTSLAAVGAAYLAALILAAVSGEGLGFGRAVAVVAVPCGALSLALGLRRLQRLELTGGSAAPWPTVRPATARLSRSALAQLAVKELRLQRAPLLLVPGASIAWALVAWLLHPGMPPTVGATARDLLEIAGYLPSAVLVLLVPLLVGANGVAAERKLGVLPQQLGLPISRRLQWGVKLAVCLLLTAASGALGLFLGRLLAPFSWSPATPLSLLLSLPFGSLLVGLYGSRLARDPLRALGLAPAVAIVGGYTAAVVGFTLQVVAGAYAQRWLPQGTALLAALLPMAILAVAVPRQPGWLAGGRLGRSAGTGLAAALIAAAFGLQAVLLSVSSRQLDAEVAAREAEIARLNLDAKVERLAAELRLDSGDGDGPPLTKMLDLPLRISIFWAYEVPGFDPSLESAATPAMLTSVLLDGRTGPVDAFEHWFWLLRFYRLSKGQTTISGIHPYLVWHGRESFSPRPLLSMAPLYDQTARRRQLDRRVRQEGIRVAASLGDKLSRLRTRDPEGFARLQQVLDTLILFESPGNGA